jgi:tryptophan synthase alpha chain
MSSLSSTFSQLQSRGEKALVTYFTVGDPNVEDAAEIMEALEEGGADVIEAGLPFSDPIGDGPTIQASSQRALDRGVTPLVVLEQIKKAKVSVPVVVMGYANTAYRIGWNRFAEMLKEAGASGALLVDLTPEEAEDWAAAAAAHGIDRIFLVAPTSSEERIAAAVRLGSGFVYAVSRLGVTGAGTQAPPEVVDMITKIKRHTDLPVCAGFGISQPDHMEMVCRSADGGVVGSSIVQMLHQVWNHGQGKPQVVSYLRSLKEAAK